MHIKQRTGFFIVGIFILTFGIALTIKADIGAGAWDAFHVGLSERVGLTVGNWVWVSGICLIFLNAYLFTAKPQYLAVGTIFFVGIFIDFWLIFILGAWQPVTLIVKLISLLAGIAIIAFGVSIYLQAKYPASPIDTLMLAISHRFKTNLMVSKTIGELMGFILALLVKGPIGLGTFIITFSIGPLVQFFFPFCEKAMKKLTEEKST